MAIRLRKTKDTLIALCAVEVDPKDGDIYLDDTVHYALAMKFARDWNTTWQSEIYNELNEIEKVRNAEEVFQSPT